MDKKYKLLNFSTYLNYPPVKMERGNNLQMIYKSSILCIVFNALMFVNKKSVRATCLSRPVMPFLFYKFIIDSKEQERRSPLPDK